jgi:hydroxymethylpyrimidine/phosphomethylpyrimidine kinase
MLNTAEVVETVAATLGRYKIPYLVVDPVMVSKSGHHLLQRDAVEALCRLLLPLATVVTPNSEEAALLAGMKEVRDANDAVRAAEKILAFGPRAVVVKGGHLGGATSNDLWYDGKNAVVLSTPRYNNRHTHGTGCTFSAALAAYLAKGIIPLEAVRYAKDFVSEAIRAAGPLGTGIGPVNHLWQFKRD